VEFKPVFKKNEAGNPEMLVAENADLPEEQTAEAVF